MYLFNSQTNYVFPQNIVTWFPARAEEFSCVLTQVNCEMIQISLWLNL